MAVVGRGVSPQLRGLLGGPGLPAVKRDDRAVLPARVVGGEADAGGDVGKQMGHALAAVVRDCAGARGYPAHASSRADERVHTTFDRALARVVFVASLASNRPVSLDAIPAWWQQAADPLAQ